MIGDWSAALEATALAGALRGSVWAYPLVNAGHILGVTLLVGAMVPLDIRLLGWWAAVPVAPLWRVLARTAAVGLGMTVICGILLFITRATSYAHSNLFVAKMVVVGIGAANALMLHMTLPYGFLAARWTTKKLPNRIRLSALISLVTWLTALTLGRLVGYF